VGREPAKRTAIQFRDRKGATEKELSTGLLGLLRVSADVLRSSGDVSVVDRRWIDENVRFAKRESR
jgi:hypothetical protein